MGKKKNLINVSDLDHHLNTWTFDDLKIPHDLNTGLVRYSDPNV